MEEAPYRWVGSGWHNKYHKFTSPDNVKAYEASLKGRIAIAQELLNNLQGEYNVLQDEREKERSAKEVKEAKAAAKSAAPKAAASKSAAAPSKPAARKTASEAADGSSIKVDGQ